MIIHDARPIIVAQMMRAAEAVKHTLGRDGMNTIISQPQHPPFPTTDGRLILSKCTNTLGGKLLYAAASQVDALVGDGTTTTAILTAELAANLNRLITAGFNPVTLRNELHEAANLLDDYLVEQTMHPDYDRFVAYC